jgi:hypothetical protein
MHSDCFQRSSGRRYFDCSAPVIAESASPAWRPLSRSVALAATGRHGREPVAALWPTLEVKIDQMSAIRKALAELAD